MKNRGYLHILSTIFLVWAGITYISQMWMWVPLIALAGIYPVRPYAFGRYFLAALIAQALHLLTAVNGMDHIQATSSLLGLSGWLYVAVVGVVSGLVFALLATTIQKFSQLLDPKRIP